MATIKVRQNGPYLVDGDDVTRLSPKAKLLRGVVHVPQERSLFPAMTVRDNLLMGGYLLRDDKELRRRIDAAAAVFPIVNERRSSHAGSLSGGEQKQVELARTLLFDPTLILLDEPSIGLDPRSRRTVFAAIQSLAAAGRTILLVEQTARRALSLAARAYVIEQGSIVADGASGELSADSRIVDAYLG